MKRIIRHGVRGLALGLIVLGLLVALAIPFSPNCYYQYHALAPTPTQVERYAYADSHLIRLGVVSGYAGGFYWENQVGRAGGPERVLTDGWFPASMQPPGPRPDELLHCRPHRQRHRQPHQPHPRPDHPPR